MKFPWNKQKLSSDFVELTVGRVYFKILTHGIVNKVSAMSTITGDILNNALYFNLLEAALVDLTNKQRDNLSVVDGDKLRVKLKDILKRHGLLEEKEVIDNPFSTSDQVWFEQQSNLQKEIVQRGAASGNNTN